MSGVRRLYLMLGRNGDILNILPLCHRDFVATGERPLLMVADAFASLLDGVDYVDPLIFPGKFEDVFGAYAMAERIAAARGAQLVCTQIYGDGLAAIESCSSFARESWARVPDAPAWGSLPLVIDRRDRQREEEIIRHFFVGGKIGKPFVVLALSGTSSPFPDAAELVHLLRNRLGEAFDFIDISHFVAPRLFDLLGLLERAHALVTVDSAVLHLAAAIPALPVVAFVTREPSTWHGTPWRPQHVARFFYDEAPERFPAVSTALILQEAARPKIWHAWSHFQPEGIDSETQRRMAFARGTWAAEYALADWRECEFKASDSTRSSGDTPIHDPRPMPYWHDIVDHVMRRDDVDSHDIIALTNADVCFTPGLTGWILDTVPRHGCAFTHRWDFYKPLTVPLANEAAVKRGRWYMGSDAFFFTVRWWRQHGGEYPDMLLGREQNDEILRQLIKRHGGLEIPGAIYHEKHPSYWEHYGNLENNPGNQYNRRLARRWFLKTGYAPDDSTWWKIPVRS